MAVPLFVCWANCSRSVLAHHLYESLAPGLKALSAGLEPGERMSERAASMLRAWGVEPGEHEPRPLTLDLCRAAGGIFVMEPDYLRLILAMYGAGLAGKSYLFADPFSMPASFEHGEYAVRDPSFDPRPLDEVLRDYDWLRERVRQIHRALAGEVGGLVPALAYQHLWAGRRR
jgi:protein-tyrosine-phosphatase